MRIMKSLVGAAVLLALTAPTFAADMDEPVLVPAQEEYQPVEIGSGWYLRGDVGYSFNNSFERTKNIGNYGRDVDGFFGSVGMGYHINDYFRAELNAGILPGTKMEKRDGSATCWGFVTTSETINGTVRDYVTENVPRSCFQTSGVETKAYDVMANAFVDLGTYSGITPYLGGGLGGMYVKSRIYAGDKDCIDQGAFTCYQGDPRNEGEEISKTSLNFAYSLNAGVAYKVTDNATLDLGYEYKAAPGAKYFEIAHSNAAVEKEGLDFHSIKLGLRYDLW